MDKTTFDTLKNNYGQYASWAIWDPDPEASDCYCSLDDYSFQDIEKRIKPNIVIIALNPSNKKKENSPNNKTKKPFSNFHTLKGDKFHHITKENIKKLIYALENGPDLENLKGTFTGAYMTDIVKRDGLGSNSNEVLKRVKKDESLQKECKEKLEDELRLLGSKKPLIIVLGRAAEYIFKNYIKLKHYYITHYSYTDYNEEQYKEEFWNAIINEYKIDINSYLAK